MEVLSCLPRRTREGSYLSGFKVNDKDGERLEVSHLLFFFYWKFLICCLPMRLWFL